MRSIGDRLSELMDANPRYKKRGGQSALAADTGVPQSTISRILSNSQEPEISNIRKLAEVFKVNAEWLINEQGEKYAPATADPRQHGEKPPELRYSEQVFSIFRAAAQAEVAGVTPLVLKTILTLLEALTSAQKAKLAPVHQVDDADEATNSNPVGRAKGSMKSATQAHALEGERDEKKSGAEGSG